MLNVASDSPSGAGRDQITDFDAGAAASSVDKIDLSAIDAQTGPGNQAFTWIGKAAFTHTKGELRVNLPMLRFCLIQRNRSSICQRAL